VLIVNDSGIVVDHIEDEESDDEEESEDVMTIFIDIKCIH
jgi:hypothetical protein